MLTDINNSISDYLFLKTIVSFITGLLSYFILVLIGIDFPVFWAFLIFILNFIPNTGSLIATIFPALISLVQCASFGPFLLVLLGVGGVQVVVGNLVAQNHGDFSKSQPTCDNSFPYILGIYMGSGRHGPGGTDNGDLNNHFKSVLQPGS